MSNSDKTITGELEPVKVPCESVKNDSDAPVFAADGAIKIIRIAASQAEINVLFQDSENSNALSYKDGNGTLFVISTTQI